MDEKTKMTAEVGQCDVCGSEMKYDVPSNRIIRAVKCNKCGEIAVVGSPPPNNMFTRCPHCKFLLVHSLNAVTVACPRVRCGKSVNVSRDPTQSVTCEVCKKTIVYQQQRWFIVCGNCCEATLVGPVPNGKQAVRCTCQALLIIDNNFTQSYCPRKNCGQLLQLQATQVSRKVSPATIETSHIHVFKDKCLGQGSFGTIYAATWGKLQCAVKLFNIPPPLGDRQTKRTNVPTFYEIIRPLCALSHPNLVKYFDLSSDHSSQFPVIAIESIQGNLTHYMEHVSEPLPLHVHLDISHDVAQALSYLHQKDIIHGNLSSTSVVLTKEGCAKVSDYEVLGLYPHVTVQQVGPHILPYMPPEAFSVSPLRTVKLDCFSWSVLALQLITKLFPSPSSQMQAVTDPRSLPIPLHLPVSEISRRKSHIDLVDHSHPLLSVLVLGLDDVGEKRPAMAEISEMISVMKLSEDYKLSHKEKCSDWCKKQLFVFEYELVRILQQSKTTYTDTSQVVEELGKVSFQTTYRTDKQEAVVPVVGEDMKANTALNKNNEGDLEIISEKGVLDIALSKVDSKDIYSPNHSTSQPHMDPQASTISTATLPVPPPYSVVQQPHAGLSDIQESVDYCNKVTPEPYEVPMSSPPPHTLLPPENPVQPQDSASEHQQNVGIRQHGGVHQFQCAVCKCTAKYQQPPDQKIGLVRCLKCKECTPLAPPPDGKLYGRCAFCSCLIAYCVTSRRLVCPRDTCKKVLFATTSDGKMIRRLSCEVCNYVMHVVQDLHDTTSSAVHMCSQCGEANPIGPAPSGKIYSRCPYCNVLFKHNSSLSRIACPRSTCQKIIEVGDGEKLSVQCDYCAKAIIFYGSRRAVMCGHCGKSTIVCKPPAGKGYLRCSCEAILIYDKGRSAVKCPMEHCGKVIIIPAASKRHTVKK